MQKRLLSILILAAAIGTKAQVTLSVQLPPAGLVQKDQLWNLVLVNNNPAVSDAILTLDVQDAITGQTVLSAAGRNFMIGKGVKVINIRDVQPIQYNFLTAELSGANIPLGTYIACYRLYKDDPKGPQPLGDECVRMQISPLSPPMLTTPANGAELDAIYPQFTWLPPAPSDMFSNLFYDIVVTGILPGQSPQEAMMNNTPFYTGNNLRQAYQVFPSAFSKLKTGQQYAWQVTARNGLNYAARTEVWSFRIKTPDSVKAAMYSSGYIQLRDKSEPAGISYIKEGEGLLIKYYSFDKEYEATVRFISADGKELKTIKQKINYGDNFLSFKLGNQFEKGNVYVIELPDRQQNMHSARFSIQ